ncbi:SGNH/GDSL hydrolase family protein [bacterium]|nr:SGNH/GDSL hydrolase family protein [bacterium]
MKPQNLIFACFIISSFLLVTTMTSPAQDRPRPFQEDDVVCFLGDSITHSRRYHSYIQLFYATRFPRRPVRVVNCGISGDTAEGGSSRLAWDVLVHKPTVTAIMFGMNDVGRGLYGPGKTGEPWDSQRRHRLEAYEKNMRRIADDLRQAKSGIVFITPSIYDQTARLETTPEIGINDALASCTAVARRLAVEYDAAVVDFHDFMSILNEKHQKDDPAFTIIGPDRVHPGDPGHLVMAWRFLKAQEVPRFVSRTILDAGEGRVFEGEGVAISNLQRIEGGLTFDSLEEALPFIVPETARPALDLVPFQDDLNRETLVVRGLDPGQYEIRIDDEGVAEASGADLGEGIDLADNPRTPMYRQALDVLDADTRRHAVTSGPIRTLAYARHVLRDRPEVDFSDFEQMKNALVKRMNSMEGQPWYPSVRKQTEQYIEVKPKEAEILEEAGSAWREMYAKAQPRPHHFEIVRR